MIVAGKVTELGPPASNPYTGGGSNANAVFAGAENLAKSADLHVLFPAGSEAHLVRGGMVTCHSDTCELILVPLSNQ